MTNKTWGCFRNALKTLRRKLMYFIKVAFVVQVLIFVWLWHWPQQNTILGGKTYTIKYMYIFYEYY